MSPWNTDCSFSFDSTMTLHEMQSLLSIGRLPLAAILADSMGPGDENPSPGGPNSEKVGEREEERVPSQRGGKELDPIPGPGAPMVPDHQNIDANPIDPRVF